VSLIGGGGRGEGADLFGHAAAKGPTTTLNQLRPIQIFKVATKIHFCPKQRFFERQIDLSLVRPPIALFRDLGVTGNAQDFVFFPDLSLPFCSN